MPKHIYTEAELTEIRSNPFTFSASPGKVVFTLAFKKFVLQNVDKPRMTIKKVFAMAGYPEYLFSQVSILLDRRLRNAASRINTAFLL